MQSSKIIKYLSIKLTRGVSDALAPSWSHFKGAYFCVKHLYITIMTYSAQVTIRTVRLRLMRVSV